MTLITVAALFVNRDMVKTREKCKNAADRKLIKSLHYILFRGKKDNGGMRSRETLSIQAKNWG